MAFLHVANLCRNGGAEMMRALALRPDALPFDNPVAGVNTVGLGIDRDFDAIRALAVSP